MALLDEILVTPRKELPPPVAAAEGSGAVGTKSAAAKAPVSPPGALGQAVQMTQAARAAAAADPALQEANAAFQQDQAARAAAAADIAANNAEIEKIGAEPYPDRPSIPRLHELPAAPEPKQQDPLRVFSQFLPVMAALGALTTRNPAVNALNAATAMINAGKARDKEEEERQRRIWIDQTKVAMEENDKLVSEYNLALNDRNASVADRLARIREIAARNQDKLALANVQSGNLAAISQRNTLLEKASGQMLETAQSLQVQQAREDQAKAENAIQWAKLEQQRLQDQKISPGNVIAPLLGKLAAGQTLTAGEQAAMDEYRRTVQGGGAPQAGGMSQFGGLSSGLTPAPAAAPQSGAPRGPAPAPAASPNVYAERVAQAKAALGRGASRDQVKAVWVQSGLSAEEFDKQVK